MKAKISLAATLTLLSLSQFACGKASIDTFATGKQSAQSLQIQLPDENAPELISLENLPEGDYRIFEIRTDTRVTENGQQFAAAFRHQTKTLGSPDNGDLVAYGFDGTPANGEIMQIAPEISLPLLLSIQPSGVIAYDIRYYWNYVRSGGPGTWAWRMSGEPAEGGTPIFQSLDFAQRKQRGVYSLREAPEETRVLSTFDGERLNVFLSQTKSNRHLIVKVTYKRTESAAPTPTGHEIKGIMVIGSKQVIAPLPVEAQADSPSVIKTKPAKNKAPTKKKRPSK